MSKKASGNKPDAFFDYKNRKEDVTGAKWYGKSDEEKDFGGTRIKRERDTLKELIGVCEGCGKEVFCEDGFFDGVVEEGRLLCNHCAEKSEKV